MTPGSNEAANSEAVHRLTDVESSDLRALKRTLPPIRRQAGRDRKAGSPVLDAPAAFDLGHVLSDWPDCRLEVRCPKCTKSAFYPVRMLKTQYGDKTFRAVLAKLICRSCSTRPAPVYLLASEHRTHCYGGPPGWAIELVAEPR